MIGLGDHVLHRKVSSITDMRRILIVVGTRPEAIKLCPLILQLRTSAAQFDSRICVTAQHRELLDQVLELFAVKPDYDLNVMGPGQSLFESTSKILAGLEAVLRDGFDFIVVQGDTTTTLCGALAGFYARIPVGHVEAGLRTGNFEHPFPEEMNRVLTSRLVTAHFAATQWAAANLAREGVAADNVFVTGNPVTDAIRLVMERTDTRRDWPFLDPLKRTILVTAHRRESFGQPFARICNAIRRLAGRGDVQVVYPVHPNPHIRLETESRLAGVANVVLIAPLDYAGFVDLMGRCDLVLTDSGGVQEEAPSLGKPVLILRDTTERPEAVEAGTAILVGTDEDRIVQTAEGLLLDADAYAAMAKIHNPYGDGYASARILAAMKRILQV
jgi:UDP-N-acetylglucosamine 2-epimerase (non-hydrolysing)